jgi:hypothetical protein
LSRSGSAPPAPPIIAPPSTPARPVALVTGASARIGCTLTDNLQIDPEHSTSALVVHHPKAKDFNVEQYPHIRAVSAAKGRS